MATATREGTDRQNLSGVIQSVNEFGIKVKGEWYNYSKFPGKTVHELPVHYEGEHVMLSTNGKWIDRLVLCGSAASAVPPVTNGANGNWRHMNDGPARVAYDDEGKGYIPEPKVTHRGRSKTVEFAAAANDTSRQPARPRTPDGVDKDTQIRRMAVLKAAAQSYQPTGGDDPDDVAAAVVRIAECMEMWVVGAV